MGTGIEIEVMGKWEWEGSVEMGMIRWE